MRWVLQTLNMSGKNVILKQVWMRISIRNYKYDSILFIFLNTHCWSLIIRQSDTFLQLIKEWLMTGAKNRVAFTNIYVTDHFYSTVVFYVVWIDFSGTRSFKLASNDRYILEKLFMAIFIYSQGFYKKSVAKIWKKHFLLFYFVGNVQTTVRPPTH